eukprot:TRINITY_DN3789_c0_g1_i2.p1 TRINITY_DN3789_c0_g1~~TRINITY_DN3789_c0_g1_i2.p1  ORF type:complete len:577 (-),score=145.70 TRINITY_DN3789_c0_g1_i2:388-2118(-)
MKFIILLLVIALSLQLARATCPVNSQGTSAVTLTVSNNNTNWVVFTLAIPDENTADGSNKITDITFNYAACSLLEWTSGVPSVSATSALESDVLPQNWRAYKDANAGCGIIYMYREVPLADFLTCLTYQTKDNGKLIYQSSSAGTLARSYEISQTADGITTSTASVIQDLYEFQISLTEEYNYALQTADVFVGISGDPVNPDGNAVIKNVTLSNVSGSKRKYSIYLLATSKFPFELRSGASGVDSVQLTSNSAQWTTGSITVIERCPATYVHDGDLCVQEVLIELTADACTFSSLSLDITNTVLQYGCAANTNTTCPLADDTTSVTGTFASTTPLTISLSSGSTCSLTTDFSFSASLKAVLTAVNGLIATGGSGGSWDTTVRRRYLYKQTNNVYFNVEVFNVASVAVISWVDIDTIAVSGPTSFTAPFSYFTDSGANCNNTFTDAISGNTFYRTCAIVPMSTSGFEQPAINTVVPYGFTVNAQVYLRDTTTDPGTKKRATFALNVVNTKAAAAISMQASSDSNSSSGAASSTTVAIAASVGVVGLALIVGLAVVIVVVVKKAKKAVVVVANPVNTV